MGAWIEITTLQHCDIEALVAPLVGAWIEILLAGHYEMATMVAPLVGAWIEILNGKIYYRENSVAPLVGAWIEIQKQALDGCREWSLLSWERGLKSTYHQTSSSH